MKGYRERCFPRVFQPLYQIVNPNQNPVIEGFSLSQQKIHKNQLLCHQLNCSQHHEINYINYNNYGDLITEDDNWPEPSDLNNTNFPKSEKPIRVLDAPGIRDNFYFNVLDYSLGDVLSAGIETKIYFSDIIKAHNSQGESIECNKIISCLKFNPIYKEKLSVGKVNGEISLLDIQKKKQVFGVLVHDKAITSLSWGYMNVLATGSKDFFFNLIDTTSGKLITSHFWKYSPICNVVWSKEDSFKLAVGYNNNKVIIWDIRKSEQPYTQFGSHQSAVKAIAWNPIKSGHILTGGGLHDRTIKLWNIHTKEIYQSITTDSQIINLLYSEEGTQFVSSLGNQIHSYTARDFKLRRIFQGHTVRVCYLCLSKTDQTLFSAAGDEFINIWAPLKSNRDKKAFQSMLDENCYSMR